MILSVFVPVAAIVLVGTAIGILAYFAFGDDAGCRQGCDD